MRTTESTSRRGILRPDAVGTKFTLARLPPSDDLAPFIERYWIVRWDLPLGETYVSETLPHPTVNVVFEAQGSAIHGIPLRRFTRTLVGRGSAVGVKFRPGAFAPLFTRPIHTLTNRSLPLTDVFDAEVLTLDREVVHEENDARATALIETYLRPRLPAPDAEVERVVEIVRVALEYPGLSEVAALASCVSLSVRTLERLFRRYVGVSPKWVLRRFRIQEAAERAADASRNDWARLAQSLGYFDQSHFVRDFKAHIGMTPVDYAIRTQRSTLP